MRDTLNALGSPLKWKTSGTQNYMRHIGKIEADVCNLQPQPRSNSHFGIVRKKVT